MKIPKYLLQAELAPVKTKDGSRLAKLKWYTGSKVVRVNWEGIYYLTLSMKPEHVRMDRLKSGKSPLLNSHRSSNLSDILGVIESADLSGNAMIRFSNRDDVTPFWNDVLDGIIRNASVGTNIYKVTDVSKKDKDGNVTEKSFLATDWEPLEVSLLPVGADPNAGFAQSAGDFSEPDIVPVSFQENASGSLVVERERLRLINLSI